MIARDLKTFTPFLLLLLMSLLFLSCKKEKNTTESKAMTELIAKLQAENKGCICDPRLDEYVWKGQTVYVLFASGMLCNSVPVFYDKNGKNLKIYDQPSFVAFAKEGMLVKNVWTCSPQ